jgi:hypothetical protein
MDLVEARKVLGVDPTASRDEIDAVWRAAVKKIHPDSNGNKQDSSEQTAVLNQAHDLALDAAAGTDLAVREMRADLDRFREEEVRRRDSEQALKKIVMHHVGDLSFRKRQRMTVAAVSGGIAVVLGLISGLSSGFPSLRAGLGITALFFTLVGAAAAAFAWGLSTQERFLELDLEEAGETLSDRAALAGTLDELELEGTFSRDDLHQSIAEWKVPHVDRGAPAFVASRQRARPLAATANRIGPRDFGRVLLAKGIELELIAEEVTTKEDGTRLYGYRRT